MDISLLIRQRLSDLGLDQRELATAIEVTESYISQLLTRRKIPPAPGRTDLYEKIGEFLKFPAGELSRLATAQRQEALKKRVLDRPEPLFRECRDLVLRKCEDLRREEIRRIFEKEAFGEVERLITQKLLDVAQGIAREELRNEKWLRLMAEVSNRSYEEMRVAILEFLDTEIFNVSIDSCVTFLEPMIDAWDIDLKTFSIEFALNPRLTPAHRRRFEFTEREQQRSQSIEPGFEQFLRDQSLSGSASEEEIEFLKGLKFRGRRPTSLYYYRELQNFRDPLHFVVQAQT